MISKSHPFFLLNPSPMPVFISLNCFNLAFSMLIFMKTSMKMLLEASVLMLLFNMMFWWLFYSGEFNLEGKSTTTLEEGVKVAMILFISSEIFFFFSFFWSYFHFFLSPSMEVSMNWPPVLITAFDCLKVPLANTLILLSSGMTVTLSHHYLNEGKKQLFNFFMFLTVCLGVLFSILQAMEYSSSFFSINDSSFGSSFFMLTGFHGIHVLIGTLFLSIVLYRNFKIFSSALSSLSFEMASWYWHFVDVVWLFLYFFLYYVNN